MVQTNNIILKKICNKIIIVFLIFFEDFEMQTTLDFELCNFKEFEIHVYSNLTLTPQKTDLSLTPVMEGFVLLKKNPEYDE